MGRLVLFIVLIPLIELALLSQLIARAGFLMTLFVVFATGIVGVSLARQQGLHVWKVIHQQLAAGKMPSRDILSGVMILLAGAFLITPGVLTDTCGFLLLIPKVRISLGTVLVRWFRAHTVASFQTNATKAWSSGPSRPFPDDEAPDEQPTVRVLDPEVTAARSSH